MILLGTNNTRDVCGEGWRGNLNITSITKKERGVQKPLKSD